MRKALRVDPGDAAPLWRQIEEGIRRLVASRALTPGAIVPSVRDLAQQLQVNPATVFKAYQRLAAAGVLAVRRGEGTFVAETAPELGEKDRQQALREGAIRYASLAMTLGADGNEAVGQLKQAWKDLQTPEEVTDDERIRRGR